MFAQMAPILAMPSGSNGPPIPPGVRASGEPELPAGEDLPYKVEIWDGTKNSVEAIVAVTASSAIGYAAYYAATGEYPDRYITLRHKGAVLIRWNAPSN